MAQAVAAPNGAAQDGAGGGPNVGSMLQTILQSLMLYYLVSSFVTPVRDAMSEKQAPKTVASNGAPIRAPIPAPYPPNSLGALRIELVDLERLGLDGEPLTLGLFQPLGFDAPHQGPTCESDVSVVVSAAVRTSPTDGTIELSPADRCAIPATATDASGAAMGRSGAFRRLGGFLWNDTLELGLFGLNFTGDTCCNRSATPTEALAGELSPPDSAVTPAACEFHPADCAASLAIRATVYFVEPRGFVMHQAAGVPAPTTTLLAKLTRRVPRPRRRKAALLLDDIPAPEAEVAEESGNTTDSLPANMTLLEVNVTFGVAADRNGELEQLRPMLPPNSVSTGSRGIALSHYDFWTLARDCLVLNSTTASNVSIRLTITPQSVFAMGAYGSMTRSFESQSNSGMMSLSETDSLKVMVLDNNPWYLGLCFTVSMLRMVFEYLAFKNDVQFWRSKTRKGGDMTGLSLRSVALSCYFQLVIFLYLLDSEGTSWAVTLPSGVGVLIEFWKLFKCVRFERDASGRMRPVWNTRKAGAADGGADETSTHDATAMRYMGYVGAPLLAIYTVHCALYQEQTGWYSFAISTQVRAIYYAGFAAMCPQIYINYKMKSVAAMPWRTLMYKFLNTIVDDLFAFVIAMPTMHRVACFRDDVVFVILLFQRYSYPVDLTRVNEYGQGGVEEDAPPPGAALAGTTIKAKTE